MDIQGLFEWKTATHTGLVRKKNEDAVAVDENLGLFVLADGMGGHKGGAIASNLAVKSLITKLNASLPLLKPGEIDEELGYTRESIAIRDAVLYANKEIYTTATEKPELSGMGTTLVAAVFYDNRLSIAHVGDSRIYRLRNDQLEQITSDHTILQELIDRGFYTEDQAKDSTTVQKNLVTRALGVEQSVAVDIKEDLVHLGDLYLFCSDGLHDLVDEDFLTEQLSVCEDLEACAENLINEANRCGGKDNISVILTRPVNEFATRQPWFKRLNKLFR